jgi:hypothetical protein
MKTIEPVVIWANGTQQIATVLNVFSSYDNLATYANLSFALMEVIDNNIVNALSQGSLTIEGTDYQNWETNDYAYTWVAAKLNLVITGEYVPPVIETPQINEEQINTI